MSSTKQFHSSRSTLSNGVRKRLTRKGAEKSAMFATKRSTSKLNTKGVSFKFDFIVNSAVTFAPIIMTIKDMKTECRIVDIR